MKLLFYLLIVFVSLYLFYSLIWSIIVKVSFFTKRKKNSKKEIFLTFDDGPSKYTDELLKILKKYNVNATFFCVANFAQKFPDVIKRSIINGNEIELHSLKHKNALLQGIIETRNDYKTSFQIMDNLGINVNYYRPPWGDANLFTSILLKENKKKVILWNVMAEDWQKDTTADIIKNKLLKRVKPGDIICLHDGRGKNQAPQKTIEALNMAIPMFLEEGYVFKLIREYE